MAWHRIGDSHCHKHWWLSSVTQYGVVRHQCAKCVRYKKTTLAVVSNTLNWILFHNTFDFSTKTNHINVLNKNMMWSTLTSDMTSSWVLCLLKCKITAVINKSSFATPPFLNSNEPLSFRLFKASQQVYFGRIEVAITGQPLKRNKTNLTQNNAIMVVICAKSTTAFLHMGSKFLLFKNHRMCLETLGN